MTQAEGEEQVICCFKPSDGGSVGGADEFFHFSLALARQMLYSSVWDTVKKMVSGLERRAVTAMTGQKPLERVQLLVITMRSH